MEETEPRAAPRPKLNGKKLQELRLAVPLTQAQLAAKARISRKRLGQHEQGGKGTCHITQFQRYADALGVKPSELMLPAA